MPGQGLAGQTAASGDGKLKSPWPIQRAMSAPLGTVRPLGQPATGTAPGEGLLYQRRLRYVTEIRDERAHQRFKFVRTRDRPQSRIQSVSRAPASCSRVAIGATTFRSGRLRGAGLGGAHRSSTAGSAAARNHGTRAASRTLRRACAPAILHQAARREPSPPESVSTRGRSVEPGPVRPATRAAARNYQHRARSWWTRRPTRRAPHRYRRQNGSMIGVVSYRRQGGSNPAGGFSFFLGRPDESAEPAPPGIGQYVSGSNCD